MSTQGIQPQLNPPSAVNPPPPARGKTLKIAIGFLAAATIAAALVLGMDVMMQPWMWNRYIEVPAPPREISPQEAILREKLNSYEKSAEDLKSLVSLLLGLSSLYALSLGVASYIGVQDAKDRADQTVDRLNKLEDRTGQRVLDFEARLEKQTGQAKALIETEVLEIRRQFPLFRDMQNSIRKIRNELEQSLPDPDYGRETLKKMNEKQRVMIEHFEWSVGAFRFFDLDPFRDDASSIYIKLGSYYNHMYAREDTEHKKDPHAPKPDPRDPDRAVWYLEHARAVSPKSIAALNELGDLLLNLKNEPENARKLLDESLDLQPDQQRARFLKAIIEHTTGVEEISKGHREAAATHFEESLELLTYALDKCTRWELSIAPQRKIRALRYNRACALARLAGLDVDRVKNSGQAMDDLDVVFPAGQEPDEQRVSDFRNDVKKDGDLFVLFQVDTVKARFETLVNRMPVSS
jgi:tetratricopeptide (TPR) repeat protein